MKIRRFILPIILAVFVSLSACDDSILDYDNPNAPTNTAFWETPEDAELGINAVYHQLLQPGTYSRWLFFRYDLSSDEGFSGSPWTELADWTRFNYVNYNFWEGNGIHWRDHYKGIFRANQVLANVPAIEFDDNTRKEQIIGEASFLRALYYFNLAVLYEDVPIVLEPSNPDDKPEQKTQEQVWAQIVTDLEVAADNLPPTWSADNVGRATKGAAYALMGKAYMQQQRWDEAQDALEWLVEGPGATYYDLVDNYEDNFRHTTENNVESVFEIQFSSENRGGKGDVSQSSLSNERPQFFAPRGIGWSDGQTNKWIIDEYKTENNLDGGFDTRLKWSIFYREMGDDFANNDLVYGRQWDVGAWGDEAFIRKYSSEYYRDFEDYYSPNNFRVIRYADVLLLYAEVINELQGPAQAVQYVNRVRQRPSTNLAPLETSVHAAAMNSRDAFRERLKMERTLELNHEGVRFMDLKRWGMFDSQARVDELAQRDPSFNNFEVGKHHRLPIPQSEVENNPNLEQHPEY